MKTVKLLQAFMPVLFTSNFDDDSLKTIEHGDAISPLYA